MTENGLPDFGFFGPRIKSLDIIIDTEVSALASSMYTIMAGHLRHGPSNLKTLRDVWTTPTHLSVPYFNANFQIHLKLSVAILSRTAGTRK